MSLALPEAIAERINRCGVVAVLTVADAAHAVPLARALYAGGIDVMELTLRTPVALEALRAIVAEVPEMTAGVGTILTPNQVAEAQEAGAAFGVAPGTNARVLEAAAARELPFAPGIATPSDIENALEYGCRVMKFFPAEPSGGIPYLKAMAAPYQHLGIRYLPLGGLKAANMQDYLRLPQTMALGGSWLAPADRIAAEDWATITRNATEARRLADEARR